MRWNVVLWRMWIGKAVTGCRRHRRPVIAAALAAALLWVPSSATRRAETDAPGEVFGPIHYWYGQGG